MNRSTEINELATALAKAQAEIKFAPKDNTAKVNTRDGKEYTYKYSTLADVWETCRGPLSKNGLAVVQTVVTDGATAKITTLLAHSSGQLIEETLAMTARDGSPQAIGSAITYGRRYGLAAMVGIASAEEDDDGAEATHGKQKKNGDGAHQLSSDDVARIQSQTCTELKASLAGAKDKAALEIVAADVSKARKEKRITDDQADKVLGPTYKARLKELTPTQVQQ